MARQLNGDPERVDPVGRDPSPPDSGQAEPSERLRRIESAEARASKIWPGV